MNLLGVTLVLMWSFKWFYCLAYSPEANLSFDRKALTNISVEYVNITTMQTYLLVTSKPKRPKCDDGNMYKYLEKCQAECRGQFLPRNKAADKGKEPSIYSFKLVILQPHEYNLIDNDTLLTELPNEVSFSRKFFIDHKNGTAYLCLPMPKFFVNCTKWNIKPEEYSLADVKRRLWIQTHKKHYEITEYALNWKTKKAEVCLIPISQKRKDRETALLAAWLVSLISLGATILFTFIFPKLNIKNRIILCTLGMLFCAYIALCSKLFVTKSLNIWCKLTAHLQQYTFLSAFCWINVQAIEVCSRFINIRASSNTSTISKKRFIIYSLYAWVIPLCITLITVVVEEAGVKNLNPNLAYECWFRSREKPQGFLYFYGPIGLILFINTVLFAITIYKLCSIQKGKTTLNKSIQNQMLIVYFKLFIVMGLSWIMEILSIAFHGIYGIWFFFDIINALQGFFIFIVYVCKPSFIKSLCRKICRNPRLPSWWPLKPLKESDGIRTDSSTNLSKMSASAQM